jgi:hypothetical protein
MGFFQRPEIGSLEVFDKGHLELLPIGELANDCRDPFEARHLTRSEPTLTGDELVAIDRFGHEDRLEDPVLADARRQRLELGGIHPLSRLAGVRSDARKRDLGRRYLLTALRNERREAAPERAAALGLDRHDRAPAGEA